MLNLPRKASKVNTQHQALSSVKSRQPHQDTKARKGLSIVPKATKKLLQSNTFPRTRKQQLPVSHSLGRVDTDGKVINMANTAQPRPIYNIQA
jgi:hypothetical protein